MVAVGLVAICLLACSFMIYVLAQFRREQTSPGTARSRGYQSALINAPKPQLLIVGTVGRARVSSSRAQAGRRISGATAVLLVIALCPRLAHTQEKPTPPKTIEERERALLERIENLERRLAELEARTSPRTRIGDLQDRLSNAGVARSSVSVVGRDSGESGATPGANSELAGRTQPAPVQTVQHLGNLDFLRGTTLNLTLDGYYGYNFNRPLGRVNLLRAYDVSSNSFSLNQAAIVLERPPDVAEGRRFGVRLDLQYGQATETLQGSAANEPRPQVYRNVFQAYGTYVLPFGSGVTVDFGKWASAMGLENNYTKDQINYSRSYLFDFLPFYHMGVRSTYSFNDRVSLSYWVVNGVQQAEDFNGSKSQVLQIILRPRKSIVWEMIYHVGREQRDLVPVFNPTLPALATQPGLSTTTINPAPDGRLHILDSYVTWNANAKLTLAAEADYVVNRLFSTSAPKHVAAGAAYARYQLSPRWAVAARAEYLSDRGGIFSGATQALKETTITTEYKFADGFLMRQEWRRDFSNRPFFLTQTTGLLKKEQNTATIGLVWWFGAKQGAW